MPRVNVEGDMRLSKVYNINLMLTPDFDIDDYDAEYVIFINGHQVKRMTSYAFKRLLGVG